MKNIRSRRCVRLASHRSCQHSIKLSRTHKLSVPRGVMAALLCCLGGYLFTSNAYGAFGDLVMSYSFPASSFVLSPTQPLMYATIPSQNSIAIINTNTLVVENTVVVGSGPTNLAFSPDGAKA